MTSENKRTLALLLVGLLLGAGCSTEASRDGDADGGTETATASTDTGTSPAVDTDTATERVVDTDVQAAAGWQSVSCGTKLSLRDVHVADSGAVYAVGGSLLGKGVIIAGDAAGFATVAQPATKLFGVHGASTGAVLAVGYDGNVQQLAGAKWSAVPADALYDFQDVRLVGGETYAVGDYNEMDYGVVARKTASGFEQVAKTAGLGVMHALWASAPSDVYAVGTVYPDPTSDAAFGVVQHFDGSAWQTLKDDVSGFFWAVWGPDASTLYVAGFRTGLWRLQGDRWTKFLIPEDWEISDIWGTAASDFYLVGKQAEAGLVVHYDGAVFHQLDLGVIDPLDGIDGSAAGGIYVVGGVDANAGTTCTLLHFGG